MSEVFHTLYAIRSKDGKYFRAKGFGGRGQTWVDEIGKARIYPKKGTARGQVSFFANNYPEYGVPDLVKLLITEVRVCDETARVEKVKKAKARSEALWKKKQAAYALQCAKESMARAQREIERLSKS